MITKKINELKKQKKLTNQKLAELSGIPLGTLNKITSGITTDPKLETLKLLAKALDCTIDDFDDSNDNDYSKNIEKTVIIMEQLNSEYQECAIKNLLNLLDLQNNLHN